MFCPFCGTEIAEGAKFCTACGQRIVPQEAPAFDSRAAAEDKQAPLEQPSETAQQEPASVEAPVSYEQEPVPVNEAAPSAQQAVSPLQETAAPETAQDALPAQEPSPAAEGVLPTVPDAVPPVQTMPVGAPPAGTPPAGMPPAGMPPAGMPTVSPAADFSAAAFPTDGQPVAAPKKKLNPLAIILPIVAVVLVAAIAVGLFLFVFKSSPLDALGKALNNTLSESAFGMEMEINIPLHGFPISMDADGTVADDPETGEKAADFSMEISQVGNVRLALYQKHLIMEAYGMAEKYDLTELYDLFDEISSQSDKTMTGDEYKENMRELLESMAGEDFLDEEAFEELAQKIDFDKLVACKKKFQACLSDQKWLEANLGFSVEEDEGETVYRFEPDLETVLDAVYDIVEEAFADRQTFDELFVSAEDVSDALTINSLVFRVKGNHLVKAELSLGMSIDGETISAATFSAEFSDFGKGSVDTEELAELLEDATDANQPYDDDLYDDDYYDDYYNDYYNDYYDDYYDDYYNNDYFNDYNDYFSDYFGIDEDFYGYTGDDLYGYGYVA